MKKSSTAADQEYVTIARVAKTQGRQGEVAADILTDFPERFKAGVRVCTVAPGNKRRELGIERAWMHKGRVVLKFSGVDSMTDAEALVGAELQVPRRERMSLEKDSAYISDLIGCELWDVSGTAREVGKITGVQSGAGEAPVLVVQDGDKEVLVPFAAEYLRRLDLDARRVEMALPTGMLELESPLDEEEKQRQQRGG